MKFRIFFLLIFWPCFLQGQNILLNPSFEQLDTCDVGQGRIDNATYWSTTTPNILVGSLTSDLFSNCQVWGGGSTPKNSLGFQYPKDGNNYAGLISYTSGALNRREYVQGTLINSLLSGKEYYVEYWVCQIESLLVSISNMGAYFSDSLIVDSTGNCLPFIPSIENPDSIMLSDTLNWMKVSGRFTAHGGEQYMIIGNFRPDSLTNIDTTYNVPGYYNYSYYYIDNVFVIPVDSLTSIQENSDFNFETYPNPTNDILNIYLGNNGPTNCKFSLYSLEGQLLFMKEEPICILTQINMSNFSKGVYMLEVKTDKGRSVKKIVKE